MILILLFVAWIFISKVTHILRVGVRAGQFQKITLKEAGNCDWRRPLLTSVFIFYFCGKRRNSDVPKIDDLGICLLVLSYGKICFRYATRSGIYTYTQGFHQNISFILFSGCIMMQFNILLQIKRLLFERGKRNWHSKFLNLFFLHFLQMVSQQH